MVGRVCTAHDPSYFSRLTAPFSRQIFAGVPEGGEELAVDSPLAQIRRRRQASRRHEFVDASSLETHGV